MLEEKDEYFEKNSSSRLINLVNIVYDDEFVHIINKLSSSIKTYFKMAKKTISEINDNLSNLINDSLFIKCIINEISTNNTIPNIESIPMKIESILQKKGNIDNNINYLDVNLNSFFDEAKKLFKTMKNTRNKKINEVINNSGQNQNSPNKSNHTIQVSQLRSPLFNNNNILNNSNNKKRVRSTSGKKRSKTLELKKKLINKNIFLTESNYDLALNVIKFLENLVELQEDILNHSLNVKDKKKKFEIEKRRLREQAKCIIEKDNKIQEEFHTMSIKQLYDEKINQSKENEKNEKKIQTLQKKILKLEDNNNKLSNDLSYLSDMKNSAFEKGNSIEKMENEMKSIKNMYEEQIVHNSQLNNENQKLNQQYNSLGEKYLDINQQFEKMNKENNDMKKSLKIKENELIDLNKKIKQLKEKNILNEKHIKEKELSINHLMKNISELKSSKDKNVNDSIQKKCYIIRKK